MKLIYCPNCQDVVRLRDTGKKFCDCKKSWGMYLNDDRYAEFGGNAIPLGIANGDIHIASLRYPKRATSVRMWVDGPTTNSSWRFVNNDGVDK